MKKKNRIRFGVLVASAVVGASIYLVRKVKSKDIVVDVTPESVEESLIVDYGNQE